MNPKDTPSPRLLARPSRRALAIAIAAATAMLSPLPQVAHADATAAETVIAPLEKAGPVGPKIVGDDADGYVLRSAQSSPSPGAAGYTYTWRSADGAVTRDLGLCTQPPVVLPQPGGGTLLAVLQPTGTGSEARVGIYDPAAGSWTYDAVALPSGQRALAVFPTSGAAGWSVLSETDVSGQPVVLHVLRPGAPGNWSDTVVSGLPAGDIATVGVRRFVTGALVMDVTAGSSRVRALLDTDTGAVVYSEPWDGCNPAGVVMNDHAFGCFDSSTSELTLRSIDAPQTVVTDTTVTRPAASANPVLTDSALILGVSDSTVRRQNPGSLISFPLDGGASTVLSTNAYAPLAAADGAVVYDAATGSGGWATYRTPAGGGAASVVRTLATYQPESIGLSLDRGRLARVETAPGYDVNAYLETADLGVAGTPAQPVQAREQPSPTDDSAIPRCDGVRCQTLVDGDDAADGAAVPSPFYLSTDAQGLDVVHQMGSATAVPLSTAAGRIVAAGDDSAVYDSGSDATRYDVDVSRGTYSAGGPVVATAWWDHAFVRATSTPGTFDLGSGTLTTDAPCVPDEIQALGRWLYWSCGASGPAGVYDTTAHRSIPVPAGQALLGDGFVLRHAGGSLVLTDVHTGTATDRTLADLPAGPYPDDRGVTWTVDKYRSLVAYTDAGGATHVFPSGVPASPPAVLLGVADVEASSQGVWGDSGWSAHWKLSRPVASWRVDIRRQGHSADVVSYSGGATRSSVAVHWDGRDASGAPVLYGAYTWTLTATPADGGDPAPVTSGTVIMAGGPSLDRDYSGDHVGDLFGLTSGGRLDLRPGKGTAPGGVRATSSSAGGWPSTSLLIPYGDLNNDDVNDLLVRDTSGHLTVYYGTSGHAFSPSGPHKVIGWGWNIYNTLTSPGDATGDTRPDLIARDTHGDLYLYAATSAGTLAARKKVGYGYQIYDTIVGVPIVAGLMPTPVDFGQFLARDPSGTLWMYSTENGKIEPRVRLGWGWNIYNAIVGVGDVNGDGWHDVVARDPSGDLWFYAGRGSAVLAPRVKIGWGWQMYKRLL